MVLSDGDLLLFTGGFLLLWLVLIVSFRVLEVPLECVEVTMGRGDGRQDACGAWGMPQLLTHDGVCGLVVGYFPVAAAAAGILNRF
ncbi:MAG TPA: hypothetical protein VGN88_04595 [Phycisphaerae bacterium]|jgi:hypothetical protein